MDLNAHSRKIMIGGGIAILLIVVLVTILVTAMVVGVPDNRVPNVDAAIGPTAAPEKSPAEAMAQCDRLASTPGDPQRTLAPVADTQFAPAAAIDACGEALSKNPQEARAHFELGRAFWLSQRDADAFEQFKIARNMGYGAASMYLGNAYRDGRLPAGDVPNLRTAIALFQQAQVAGVEGAQQAAEDAQQQLDRMTFDKAVFQNGDYMQRIYDGNYEGMSYPLSMLYYVQGLAHGLEDNNVVFIDQSCRQLVSKAGLDIIANAEGPVAIAAIFGSKDSQGNLTAEGTLNMLQSALAKDYLLDQGQRDATVLYNEDGRYGCKSEVTKQILSHMMLVIKNNNAPPSPS